MSNSKIDRRTFLGTGVAGLTILGTGHAAETKTGPVVETTSGKIRGMVINKVNAFKGIPYGSATLASCRRSSPRPGRVLATPSSGDMKPRKVRIRKSPRCGDDPRSATIVRRLPAPERLDERPQRQASGDGVAARRRIHQRQRQLHDLRRRESCPESVTWSQ